MKCKICNKEFKRLRNLSLHLTKEHKLSIEKYYSSFENFKIPKCEICKKDAKRHWGLVFFKTCGSDSCKQEILSRRQHSEITKQKISQKRIEYIKQNKNYKWSCFGKETKPEEQFKEIISHSNIPYNVYQYYIPFNTKNYEIDFAIPEIRLGFEINGNQHYDKNGHYTEYHLKRKEFLINNGWKIADIHYSLCFNKLKIQEIIIQSLNNNIDFSDSLNKEIINIKLQRKIDKEKEKNEIFKRKIKKQQDNEDKKTKIINSSIDFSKFGWVNEVAKLINKYPQKINQWMKKYMLEFYNEKCFKRKYANVR